MCFVVKCHTAPPWLPVFWKVLSSSSRHLASLLLACTSAREQIWLGLRANPSGSGSCPGEWPLSCALELSPWMFYRRDTALERVYARQVKARPSSAQLSPVLAAWSSAGIFFPGTLVCTSDQVSRVLVFGVSSISVLSVPEWMHWAKLGWECGTVCVLCLGACRARFAFTLVWRED